MSYYIIDKRDGKWKSALQIALETPMVADLPGWESPRPRSLKRRTKMTEQPFIENGNLSKPQNINTKEDIIDTDFHFGKKFGNSQDGNPNTPDIPVTGTNIDPWLGVAASILIAGGSFFVGKGYLTSSALAQIVGAVLSLAATVFVAWQTTTNKKITSLAKTLDVPKVALKRHIVALRNNHAANKGN